MKSLPNVIKANGQVEPFNPSKLERSLARSQASTESIAKIISHLEAEMTEGMTTAQIYKHAFFLLHKMQKGAAERYSLRRAVSALGPSGFPFEKYIAEIFKNQGYSTETDQIVTGGCVQHEVDVIAWNEKKLIMAEVKFHNELGTKTDLKVALYVKARADDLHEATFFYGDKRRPLDEAWLITNTKFTTTAIEYAMCKGLIMVGWNYPSKGNLQDMIEDGDLMPITVLTDLHQNELKTLLDKGIVLCKQIRGNTSALIKAGIVPERAQKIVEEVDLM